MLFDSDSSFESVFYFSSIFFLFFSLEGNSSFEKPFSVFFFACFFFLLDEVSVGATVLLCFDCFSVLIRVSKIFFSFLFVSSFNLEHAVATSSLIFD